MEKKQLGLYDRPPEKIKEENAPIDPALVNAIKNCLEKSKILGGEISMAFIADVYHLYKGDTKVKQTDKEESEEFNKIVRAIVQVLSDKYKPNKLVEDLLREDDSGTEEELREINRRRSKEVKEIIAYRQGRQYGTNN
jgi:hypothetical protein